MGQQASRPRKWRALHHWQAFPQFNILKHAAHRKDFLRFYQFYDMIYIIHILYVNMYIIDVNMSLSFRATPSQKKMHHPAKRLTGVDFLKATVDA